MRAEEEGIDFTVLHGNKKKNQRAARKQNN